MSLRGFLIVIVCQHKNSDCSCKLIGAKKGRTFSLIYFFGSFCIYYIPQATPHAIPQTPSFYIKLLY